MALHRFFPRAQAVVVTSIAPASVRLTSRMEYTHAADGDADRIRLLASSVHGISGAVGLEVQAVSGVRLLSLKVDAPSSPRAPRSWPMAPSTPALPLTVSAKAHMIAASSHDGNGLTAGLVAVTLVPCIAILAIVCRRYSRRATKLRSCTVVGGRRDIESGAAGQCTTRGSARAGNPKHQTASPETEPSSGETSDSEAEQLEAAMVEAEQRALDELRLQRWGVVYDVSVSDTDGSG